MRVGAPSTQESASTIWLKNAVYPFPYRAIQPILNTIEPLEEIPVPRHAVLFSIAVFAMLAAAKPSDPAMSSDPATSPNSATECPKNGSEVVVKALRFSEGPPSYSFMVTNNGTRPIHSVSLGAGSDIVGDMYIKAELEAVPTSVGSPSGWKGMHVFAQDPRLPKAHSNSLITYLWTAEDPEAWIQPDRSLSGFSVQLPAPKKDQSKEERRRVHPDLTAVPFRVRPYAARCPVIGTVELD